MTADIESLLPQEGLSQTETNPLQSSQSKQWIPSVSGHVSILHHRIIWVEKRDPSRPTGPTPWQQTGTSTARSRAPGPAQPWIHWKSSSGLFPRGEFQQGPWGHRFSFFFFSIFIFVFFLPAPIENTASVTQRKKSHHLKVISHTYKEINRN